MQVAGETKPIARTQICRLKGKKIAHVAEAKMFHSHNYTIGQDFRRYFDMGIFHKKQDWLLVEFSKPQGEAVKYIKSEMTFLWKQKNWACSQNSF